MNKTITVDGPAGSGKSSMAKLLASRINYTYLDTGAIYRALTYQFIEGNISPRDKQKIESTLASTQLEVTDVKYMLNGEDVTTAIREEVVEKAVAIYAQVPEVRAYVRSFQHRVADEKNMVIDGRDIGTEVFPDAFCKFYLDARLKVRAQRRFDELKKRQMDNDRSLEEIMREVAHRDKMDKERVLSPLRIPNDALIIDASELSIDEVIEEMVNHYNNKLQLLTNDFSLSSNDQSEEFFKAIQEDKPASAHSNEFIDARVISIGEEIYLDVGRKVDAYISHEEVKRLGEITFKVGDVIQVVEKTRTRTGILVSKRDADRWQGLLKLRENLKANEIVTGVVKDINKGGYVIDIEGTEAFCPLSEYDVMKSNKKEDEIGVSSEFEILSLDLKSVVVSRKRPLERQHMVVRKDFFETVKEGDRFPAKVVHVMSYRIIVRLKEGVNAIIRQKEFSWTRSGRMADLFNKDDEFEVVVIAVDKENLRLEVSKRLTEIDPFVAFSDKHQIGDVVSGEVVSTERYGVFVEVESGVDGMIHISDLSWFKKVGHPKEVVKIGETINSKILTINTDDRRLSLGYKQVDADPWGTMDQLYPIGTTMGMKITAVIKNGFYGVVDDKVEAFIHISDTKYKNDEVDFTTIYAEAQEVEGTILRINKAKHRIELGLLQKSDNPWEDLKYSHGQKDPVMGEVTEILENGVSVKVLNSIVGFCHLSQLSDAEEVDPATVMKVGEKHSFLIQFIDVEKEKLSLSRKEFLELEKYRDINQYVKSDGENTKMKVDDMIGKDTDTDKDTDKDTSAS